MRTSSAASILLLLLLGGCSSETGATGENDDVVDCALGGATAFAPECTVERSEQEGTLFLVVRHPDGAFRRFEVLRDGRGLAVADGADAAATSMSDDGIELTVGADRYRFPATIRGDEPR